VNTGDSVNVSDPTHLREVDFADAIRRILATVPWLQEVRTQLNPAPFERVFDIMTRFRVPQRGPEVELWIDVQRDPRPSQFPYVCMEREFEEGVTKRVRSRVFAAPFLSPRMREVCEGHGWNWFDLAGNFRITIPGVIHLERTGKAPVYKRPRSPLNFGTPECGRVIRVLLAPENAGIKWTQRQMHMETFAGVSLGMVNKVIAFLRDEAYVSVREHGGFVLRDPERLLFAWRDAYRFNAHRRRGYFTLLRGSALGKALAQLGSQSGNYAAYAAFSAADFQAPHVRQPKTWLYVEDRWLPLFEKLVEAKPVDSGDNIVVLIPNDAGVFAFADAGRSGELRLACTNPAQTYVDLWHAGGRGQEAAEAVLEQRLKPQWKEKGL